MTKKHFISLADHVRGEGFTLSQLDTLAHFCAYHNGNFNRERWFSYIAGECGPNGGTIKPPHKPRTITPERKLARRLEGK